MNFFYGLLIGLSAGFLIGIITTRVLRIHYESKHQYDEPNGQ